MAAVPTLPDLLARAAELRTLDSHIRIALTRLIKGPDRVARANARPNMACGVALYQAASAWPALEADRRAFQAVARRAPDAVESYLQRTGGHRSFLSDSVEFQIYMLDEQRRARFRAELSDAPPSQVRDLYEAAIAAPGDEHMSLVRFVEAKHSAGWAGALPTAESEITAAVELRRLVTETRDSRVPVELTGIADTITKVARLISKAQDPRLYGVEPVNPQQQPAARFAYEAEWPEWAAEATAAEAAEALQA